MKVGWLVSSDLGIPEQNVFTSEGHEDRDSVRLKMLIPIREFKRLHHLIDGWSLYRIRVPTSLEDVLHLNAKPDVFSVLREFRSNPSAKPKRLLPSLQIFKMIESGKVH